MAKWCNAGGCPLDAEVSGQSSSQWRLATWGGFACHPLVLQDVGHCGTVLLGRVKEPLHQVAGQSSVAVNVARANELGVVHLLFVHLLDVLEMIRKAVHQHGIQDDTLREVSV